MDPASRRSAIQLAMRFILLAPLCLVLWLLVLPYYVEILADAVALVLTWFSDYGRVRAEIEVAGFLNTETKIKLIFIHRTLTMPGIGQLVTNVAPFIALVLATPQMGTRRRLIVVSVGTLLISLSHLVTLVVRLPPEGGFQTGRTPFTTTIGFFSITLPFLLWIVMAYWGHLRSFLDEDSSHKNV